MSLNQGSLFASSSRPSNEAPDPSLKKMEGSSSFIPLSLRDGFLMEGETVMILRKMAYQALKKNNYPLLKKCVDFEISLKKGEVCPSLLTKTALLLMFSKP
jgi:hypothetical protein